MSTSEVPASSQSGPLDDIVRDLHVLREAEGNVSYAELVRRIAAVRRQRGVPDSAATPARSTVYNTFALGRRRVDSALLRDTVLALGASEEEAAAWVQRAHAAQRSRPTPPAMPSSLKTVEVGPRARIVRVVLALVVLMLVNHSLHLFIIAPLRLPIYLDMVGTAVAALMLGPWYGVAVAASSSLTGALLDGGTLAFTLVNIAGALVWGYGVRRFGLGRGLLEFFALNVLVAVVCSLVATPILVIIHGGAYGQYGLIAESLQSGGMSFLAATFTSNISTSLLDKLLTGFIALVVFVALHSRLGVPAGHMPLIGRLSSVQTQRDVFGPRIATS